MVTTVIFLFTDIEGSTQLWERHQQAMQAPLARHDALLRQAVAAHNGQVVKMTGDGCHAAFTSALEGALAALQAQQALAAETWPEIAPHALRVRMGLYAGEVEARAGDYYGSSVNRAARLMSVAHGGQILISQVAADLLRDRLPAGAALRDMGEHHLKDLTRPERILQLTAPGLRADFPPIKSLDAFGHNLPLQLTRFIGREREVAEIRRLLGTTALLTLTGSGGTGKTRLSLQAAADLLPDFADGAWLVELAPLADPALVVQTIAVTLGLREQGGRPLADSLADFLRSKQLLLLLDNCEHLIAACAGAADRLLHQCPRLKIIASSREALGIAGETTYPVPSLSLPDPRPPSAAGLAQSEAARLFVDRAQAALPAFALTDDNAPAVALICRRLDGIPLAIELAAARVKLLRVEQIADRLDDRFRLLTGGSRTALPRQQTLRALIDWSYALLAEPERVGLQQLSVFAGGWTLAAAEEVVSPTPHRAASPRDDPLSTLDLLSQLANKSLIVVEPEAGDETRYRLLETIRQYARERLIEAGDPVPGRERHLGYFLRYAGQARRALLGSDMVTWLNRCEREHDNFRAALDWSLETDPLAALQLASLLGVFWARRGYLTEGLGWLEATLARAAAVAPAEGEPARAYQSARASALAERAQFGYWSMSNAPAARAAAEESVRLARRLDDELVLGRSLAVLGMACAYWGDTTLARAAAEESLALARKLDDAEAMDIAQGVIFQLRMAASPNWVEARAMQTELLRLARQIGNPWRLAMVTLGVGRIASESGDLVEAGARFKEAIELFRQVGDLDMANHARSDLARALRRQGEIDQAVVLYRDNLLAWQHLGHRAAIANQLESLAYIALTLGDAGRAARLLGAAESLREASGAQRMRYELAEYEQVLADLTAQMSAPELAAAWSTGRALTLEQAIEYALGAGGPT